MKKKMQIFPYNEEREKERERKIRDTFLHKYGTSRIYYLYNFINGFFLYFYYDYNETPSC